ncbi:MAG: hypothetical protein AAF943_16705 [Pseudomonadota bacterium]
MRALIFSLVLAVGTPLAASCPEPSDVRDELRALVAEAKAAQSVTEGRRVAAAMWQVLLRAPDKAAQEALDAGMARREVFDFTGAIKHFDTLVTYCPTYAEGFNQRAFVNYLREDYAQALVDLDVALDLQPLHVGAQSGRALTLMNLGRIAEARAQMLAAVENNPWLSEAALLGEGAPLGPQGEEL